MSLIQRLPRAATRAGTVTPCDAHGQVCDPTCQAISARNAARQRAYHSAIRF